jgi:two-component sensor histidine kinase
MPFNGMFFCFGLFIIACGASHVMEVWTLWTPLYWLSGAIKAITAAASITTAVLLVLLMPKALAIPRSSDLVEAHEKLRLANEILENRTTELSAMLLEREGLLRETTSLLQEVHHRVKNNLQTISSLLNLKAMQIGDKDTRAVFLESQGRVRSIALLHESLYQSDDLGNVDMQAYVDRLIGTLRRTYGQAGSHARFAVSMDHVHLPVDAAVPCGLIVNELVTNAQKHAFIDARDATRNEIRIEMVRAGDEVTLLVADNGSGFDAEIDPGRDETMGLTLVRDLSAQLGGTAEFASVNGARCVVRFRAPS